MARRPQLRWFWALLVLASTALIVLLPAAAGAQDGNYPVTSTTTVTECVVGVNAEVCGTVVTVPTSSQEELPFTGGDVALLTVLGIAAAGAGAGLVYFGRRSHANA